MTIDTQKNNYLLKVFSNKSVIENLAIMIILDYKELNQIPS